MKIKQVRELSDEELRTELTRLRKQVFELHSQAVTEKVENPSIVVNAKHDIARILTVINERHKKSTEKASAGK